MTTTTYSLFVLRRFLQENRAERVAVDKAASKLVTSIASQAADELTKDKELIEFDPSHTPDKDELHEIKPLTLPAYLKDLPDNPTSAETFNPDKQGTLIGFCMVRSKPPAKNHIVFQVATKKSMLQKGRTFLLSGDTYRPNTSPGITLDESACAVLDGDSLRFRSFSLARRILDLDDHFKDATDQEIETFVAGNHLWKAANVKAVIDCMGQPLRKKISIIVSQYGPNLANLDVNTVRSVAKNWELDLSTTGSGSARRIVVPEDAPSLRKFVHLIADDLLESPWSHNRFIVNSKRRVK